MDLHHKVLLELNSDFPFQMICCFFLERVTMTITVTICYSRCASDKSVLPAETISMKAWKCQFRQKFTELMCELMSEVPFQTLFHTLIQGRSLNYCLNFFLNFFSEMIPEVHFLGVGHGTLKWIRYYGADTLLRQCYIPNQPPPHESRIPLSYGYIQSTIVPLFPVPLVRFESILIL